MKFLLFSRNGSRVGLKLSWSRVRRTKHAFFIGAPGSLLKNNIILMARYVRDAFFLILFYHADILVCVYDNSKKKKQRLNVEKTKRIIMIKKI